MEEVSQVTPEEVKINQPEKNSPESSHSHKSLFIIIGFLFIAFIVLAGIGGYYFGAMKSNEPVKESNNVVQEKNTIESSPTPTKMSDIPNDWIINESANCSVKVIIPPKKAPYFIEEGAGESKADEGGYWMYEETSNGGLSMFEDYVYAIFRNPTNLGSGYVAGGVFINCNKNEDGINSEELANLYIDEYIAPYEILNVVKRENMNLWGQDVVALYIEGGMQDGEKPNYFFANDNGQYSVLKQAMSNNESVIETTNIIFENLSFE